MSESFIDKHHFLMRRLHSLTGIVPIGVFLIGHLTTNSSIVWGAINKRAQDHMGEDVVMQIGESTARQIGTFQHEVTWINESLPFLILIEITLWVSIGFHSVLGWYYATTGRSNTGAYKYQANWRYSLQRWSGYIGIFFIVYHVATLRWGWTWLIPGGTKWSHHYASSTTAAALQGSTEGWTAMGLAVSLFYLLGVTLLIFHFANGLWTAAITWGLTVSRTAQRRWGYVCAAVGIGLMGAGWSAVVGFALLDQDEARMVERSMLEEKGKDVGDKEVVETNPPSSTNDLYGGL
ncbi:MAG: hypothetical protein AAGD00_05130 [Planctomycetota bacterium]